jgi:hypothetical protein
MDDTYTRLPRSVNCGGGAAKEAKRDDNENRGEMREEARRDPSSLRKVAAALSG